MKKLRIDESQWVRIGVDAGWLKKEALFGFGKPKYTPAQQEYINRKQLREQQMLDQIRIVETYLERIEGYCQIMKQIQDEIERDPAMITFIRSQPSGEEVKNNLMFIDQAADALKRASDTIQLALQKAVGRPEEPKPELPIPEEPAAAPEEPLAETPPAEEPPTEVPTTEAPATEMPPAEAPAPVTDVDIKDLPELVRSGKYKLVYMKAPGQEFEVGLVRDPVPPYQYLSVQSPLVNKNQPFAPAINKFKLVPVT